MTLVAQVALQESNVIRYKQNSLFISLSSSPFSRLCPSLLQRLSLFQILYKVSPPLMLMITFTSLLKVMLCRGYAIEPCVVCECDAGFVVEEMIC